MRTVFISVSFVVLLLLQVLSMTPATGTTTITTTATTVPMTTITTDDNKNNNLKNNDAEEEQQQQLDVESTTIVIKENMLKDLPSNAPMRIGIKYRPSNCTRRTKKGDILEIHYVGKLYKNLKTFDSSRERNVPFRFVLGAGEVIKGLDRGLYNMCIGEKRKLVIPANLGYGNAGAQHDIKSGTTLIYYVELLNIYNADEPPDDIEDYYGYGTNFWTNALDF